MDEIDEILDFAQPVSTIIGKLKVKVVNPPDWALLEKQYNPKLHPVMADKDNYHDVNTRGGVVHVARITLGYQKLATHRMSQLTFGIPVKRIYNAQNDDEKTVAGIMEDIYKKNRINAVNMNRGRYFYGACEFMTIWYTQPMSEGQFTFYGGQKSNYKIRCRTYSPMLGDKLYPLFDEYGDMIAMSVEYTRRVGTTQSTYFETFAANKHYRWVQGTGTSGWMLDVDNGDLDNTIPETGIGKIPGIYEFRPEPIWEDTSENIFENEWTLSRNSNYLRKNLKPNWVIFSNKPVRGANGKDEDDKISRNVYRYPADAKAGYVTWDQAIDNLKFQTDTIRKEFFEQCQLPDISFENMKAVPMSADSRKMILADAQLKVTEEEGTWLDAFDRENNVLRAFIGTIWTNLADAANSLQIDTKITPYSLESDSDNIDNGTKACGNQAIMSQKSAIQRYTDISDPDAELKQIQDEENQRNTSLLENSTI
jgi:hypothetical protein